MKITRSDLRKLIRDAYCDSSKPQTNESLAAIGRWVMSNKLMTGMAVARKATVSGYPWFLKAINYRSLQLAKWCELDLEKVKIDCST